MNNLPLNTNMVSKDSTSIIKAFFLNFVSDDFFSRLINICLYPAEIGGSLSNGGTGGQYIRQFLTDMSKMVNILKLNNAKQIQSNIKLSSVILNIRDGSPTVINYDNVNQHLPGLDLSQSKLVANACNNKILNTQEFRSQVEQITSHIKAFYEIEAISSGIILFENFVDHATTTNASVFETIKHYKDNIVNLYNDLSKLQSLNNFENEKNYFIISDKNSTKDLAKTLVSYISTGYSFLKTGFKLFDKHIEGMESSSVHVISAPSNHGKSIFMTNLCHSIIESNINDFEEGDTILFVTLEDSFQKLVRRFCSIFGNYKQETVKLLYKRSYEAIKANQLCGGDNNVEEKSVAIMNNLLQTSLFKVCKGKVNLLLMHSNENTFSPGDLSKFIDAKKIEGLKIKMAFIDYIDVMSSTVKRYADGNDYDVTLSIH